MTNLQRFMSFAFSLFLIACGLILLLNPHNGLSIVAIVLSVMLLLYGVRKLFYYLTMARHMTGGLALLFIAVIALDVSVFAVTVVESPQFAIALYLFAYNTITGLLAIARGIESKLFKSPWVLSVMHGLLNIGLAALCVIFVNSEETIIGIFCCGLFYNAGVRMISVFKPTEIVYIQ